jgi:lipopolysaccharide transport system ATP-binding protein
MSSERPAIRAEGLGKVYTVYARPLDRLLQSLWRGRRQFGRRFAALAEVSFALPRGAVLGIVGKNGAGKSTLLQIVCGTLAPTSGRIEVAGRVAALLELGAGFNPEFTGRENVFLNAAVLGLPEEEIRARYDDIVAFSGIADFIDQPVKTYSSGMHVRLAFAIATSVDPDILVIDEALSVGDGAFARRSFDRIMALREKGATILFCSHSTYHVDALCDQALWLDAGKVRMLDAAPTVTAAYNAALAVEAADMPAFGTPAIAAGRARIETVEGECEGLRGRQLRAFSQRSCVEVTVAFRSDPALPAPSVALGIENAAGVAVSSVISIEAPGAVHREPDGRGWAKVAFPDVPLLKGTYHVTAFLACERGLHVYDAASRCLTIEVAQEGVVQGVVALPHRWEGGNA